MTAFLLTYWVFSILIIWFSIDEKLDKEKGTDLYLLFAPIYLLVLIGRSLRKYYEI
jgi:hypothetical protein